MHFDSLSQCGGGLCCTPRCVAHHVASQPLVVLEAQPPRCTLLAEWTLNWGRDE